MSDSGMRDSGNGSGNGRGNSLNKDELIATLAVVIASLGTERVLKVPDALSVAEKLGNGNYGIALEFVGTDIVLALVSG